MIGRGSRERAFKLGHRQQVEQAELTLASEYIGKHLVLCVQSLPRGVLQELISFLSEAATFGVLVHAPPALQFSGAWHLRLTKYNEASKTPFHF